MSPQNRMNRIGPSTAHERNEAAERGERGLQMSAEENNLGMLIDRLDNLAHALTLHVPDSTHVAALRQSLPEAVDDFKAAFVALTGENPWA